MAKTLEERDRVVRIKDLGKELKGEATEPKDLGNRVFLQERRYIPSLYLPKKVGYKFVKVSPLLYQEGQKLIIGNNLSFPEMAPEEPT